MRIFPLSGHLRLELAACPSPRARRHAQANRTGTLSAASLIIRSLFQPARQNCQSAVIFLSLLVSLLLCGEFLDLKTCFHINIDVEAEAVGAST